MLLFPSGARCASDILTPKGAYGGPLLDVHKPFYWSSFI
jgi:hypothetical protein